MLCLSINFWELIGIVSENRYCFYVMMDFRSNVSSFCNIHLIHLKMEMYLIYNNFTIHLKLIHDRGKYFKIYFHLILKIFKIFQRFRFNFGGHKYIFENFNNWLNRFYNPTITTWSSHSNFPTYLIGIKLKQFIGRKLIY